MESNQEFINYLFELRGRAAYGVNIARDLCKEECTVPEAGRRMGRLEVLEKTESLIEKIIEKYLDTHGGK
jgi:hypothetical protein